MNKDIKSVPAKLITTSTLPVLSIVGFVYIYEAFGGTLNPHGNGILIILLLFVFGFGAFVCDLICVPLSILRMKQNDALKTKENIASVAWGLTYIVLFTALFSMALLK